MASSAHYFYVLQCADETFYAGYTTDPTRRLAQHNNGTGAKYTRLAKRQPMKMIHLEKFDEKSPAMQAEYAFKQLTKAKKRQYLASHTSQELP